MLSRINNLNLALNNKPNWFILICCCFIVFGCDQTEKPDAPSARDLDAIKASGTLRVLTRNAPSTYYFGRDGEPTGPEYEMAAAFATHLGVELDIIEKPSVQHVVDALAAGEGDIAAAGLTITPERKALFRFGRSYQEVSQQVVCRRDNVQPESVKELIGLKVMVIANSSYSERLAELKTKHPELTWQAVPSLSTEDILYKLWEKEIDCTVADSNIVDINRRYFPELITPFNLTAGEPLAWMIPKSHSDVQKAVDHWFKDYESSGRLAALLEQYYGFFAVFDYVDTRKFIRRIHSRLPKYEAFFKQASKQYDVPYTLLAAQAYQESHWRADAKSPTGVRGLMMLTRNTAKSVGVKNRLNPQQSIDGGAKYFQKLKANRFSDNVTEPDLTWLTLAAYNIGRAHLHDAQTLARRLGLNPHTWGDMKQVLPLLSQKRYHKDLKYGYARGTEPVQYVQRIREYQHILENELRAARQESKGHKLK